MVSCLSSNTMSSVGCYGGNGASSPITSDRKLFNRIQAQEGSMSVELTNDATYPIKGLGPISFLTPSSDLLELNGVLFLTSLKKNILSISYMANLQYRVAFEWQWCTINDCSLASMRTLAWGVWDGDINRLLVDPMALVQSSEKVDGSFSFEEAYTKHVGGMPWR